MKKSITERFWSKVDVCGKDECWEWQGARSSGGYGSFMLEGRARIAHRIAFYLHYHHLPNLDICHSCDNRACCNPNHLWAGTALDNVRDMEVKGRAKHPAGSDNRSSKLTEEQVLEVRRLVTSGIKQIEVGKRFGVAKSTISGIVSKKSWKHI